MNENRYAPPKSVVEDVAATAALQARPPAQVTNAIKLWAASYVIGLVLLVWDWEHYTRLQSSGALVLNQIFALAVSVWLYYKIYVGRNWARITWLVLAVLGGLMSLTGAVRSIVSEMPTIAKVHMVLGIGINVVILWLLFFSSGRKWFERPK